MMTVIRGVVVGNCGWNVPIQHHIPSIEAFYDGGLVVVAERALGGRWGVRGRWLLMGGPILADQSPHGRSLIENRILNQLEWSLDRRLCI